MLCGFLLLMSRAASIAFSVAVAARRAVYSNLELSACHR
jgi:hypothetical protein